MSKRKNPIIAICYDFDGTLSPGNMQEYDYLPELGISPKQFWDEAKAQAREHDADEILSYMSLMIVKATPTSQVQITRKSFADHGRNVKFFEGVMEWFERINAYGETVGAKIEHYIISSGIKEMIEGTSIKKEFKRIYASSFIYDQHGVARWPAQAVNYTTKTQYLFRINKGVHNAWDNSTINAFTRDEKRRIPFSRMIFIGDGSTDIPCMKLVKSLGGYSIAVYPPGKRRTKADALKEENRVDFVAPADYKAGSAVDVQVQAVIQKMVADHHVQKGPRRRKASVSAQQDQKERTSDAATTPLHSSTLETH